MIIDLRARERRHYAKEVNRHSFQNVLIEHVADGVGVAAVRLPPVEEEQVFKEFELTNCIVGGSYSLLTFKAGDTNADVGRCDHIHIISSITDC